MQVGPHQRAANIRQKAKTVVKILNAESRKAKRKLDAMVFARQSTRACDVDAMCGAQVSSHRFRNEAASERHYYVKIYASNW